MMNRHGVPPLVQRGEPSRGREGTRPEIKVWSDFVCPYCFLAEGLLNEATQGLDVRIDWMPFELRPYPEPTLRPEGEYLQTVWRRSVYPLASRLGVEIRLPDVSPQPYSRAAHEGLLFAKQHGKAAEYADAVFRAFFQRSLDIGDVRVLQSIAQQIGLGGAAFAAALMDGRYTADHQASLALALRLGIRAVPTIVVGGEHVVGMPDPVSLRRLLVQLGNAERDSGAVSKRR